MANAELVNMLAEAFYEKICNRAMEAAEEALPPLNETERLLVEAAIAAGVTATFLTLKETGVLPT